MSENLYQVQTQGASLDNATSAVILVHGRGASAESILSLAEEMEQPDCAFLAIQAPGYSWYPYSFLAPIHNNEPHLSRGLQAHSTLVESLIDKGIPRESIVLMGFSQGACLALEFAARHPGRYGGIVAFSGGLITTDHSATTMDGTPVFLGCSDDDPHIPLQRVNETAEVFGNLGANVDKRIYPGMGHTINKEEMDAARALIEGVRRDT